MSLNLWSSAEKLDESLPAPNSLSEGIRFDEAYSAPRVLAHFRSEEEGPLVICASALHGNEPAGVIAAQNVAAALTNKKIPFRGELFCFTGNTQALRHAKRYMDFDLNRCWTEERLEVLRRGDKFDEGKAEDFEQEELFSLLDSLLSGVSSQVVFVDLHTTSSDGAPFLFVVGEDSHEFVRSWPISRIHGLVGDLEGLLVNAVVNSDRVTSRDKSARRIGVAIEGGWHLNPLSVHVLEASLWLTLVESGFVDAKDVPGFDSFVSSLSTLQAGTPADLTLSYHHWIEPEDDFIMRPGYHNLVPIDEGQFLAHDKSGPVLAPHSGYLFMPLYQPQGNQGFLIVRPQD